MSEGELMVSEDLEGDISESKVEALERENPKVDKKEGRMEFTIEVDQVRGPEVLSDEEIDLVRKRREHGTGVTRWKWDRCGRMCRGPCLLDAASWYKLIVIKSLISSAMLLVIFLLCC